MGEESGKETNVKATIDAVAGLVKAIPIYQDTLQPAAKQLGKTLETVSKTVNIALAPIKAMVWGYEKIEEFVTIRVSQKLQNIPNEDITTPPPQVAGPAIEALRYAGHDINLRELYANLLATSMDKTTINNAHPAFVEILRNLNSDEALILKSFLKNDTHPLIDIEGRNKITGNRAPFYKNLSNISKSLNLLSPELTQEYLTNFCRLGITEIPAESLSEPNIYDQLEKDERLNKFKKFIEDDQREFVIFRKLIRLTSFGVLFLESVVRDREESPEVN